MTDRRRRGSNNSKPSFRDGPEDQISDAQLRIGEPRDSGFDVSHRPGMTGEASLAGLGILDVEFPQRTGDDEIIVIEHKRA
jgi:hypothetical protein